MKRWKLLTFLTLYLSSIGYSAEPTMVMTSFYDGSKDPFDFMLYPEFQWIQRKASVSREGYDPMNPLGTDKVLDAKRVQFLLNLDLRIGLYKDFEAFLVFPFVLSDKTEYSSSGNYGDQVMTSFGMPSSGPTRSGFGDMTWGLRYSPFQQWRDKYYPSWVLVFSHKAPTGKVKRGSNGAVGLGYHELHFETAVSRRMAFIEPYFSFGANLRIPSKSTLFKDYNSDTQGSVWPAPDIGMTMGVEFVPWEKRRKDGKPTRFVSLQLGGGIVYTFQGRGYSDLFEGFGRSSCSPDNPAACLDTDPTTKAGKLLTTQYNWISAPGNVPSGGIAQCPPNGPCYMDGITDIGAYSTYSVFFGFTVQPIEYLSFRFKFDYAYESSHVLTQAIVGNDLDSKNNVEFTNSKGVNEYNPVYNSSIDAPGKRFFSDGAHIFGITLSLSGQF